MSQKLCLLCKYVITGYLKVGLLYRPPSAAAVPISVFWGFFFSASLSQCGNSLEAKPDISNLFTCGMLLSENVLETSCDEIR